MSREFNPEWVEHAKINDALAITELYNYCEQSVYLTIKSLIKSDEDTVMDLLQDTFLKAFTSLEQLGDNNKFPTWVKTIARNKALDWLRRNQKLRLESIDGDEDHSELQLEDDRIDEMPEVQMDQKETARLIQEILNSLSDGQRTIVSMYYYQELTIPEIARILNCREGTVKSQLCNGRKKIEEKVRELEREGTKLYGFMPFPFFALLLRNMEQFTIEPDAVALANIMQGLQTSTAAQAGNTTSTVTASTKIATGTQAKIAGVAARHVVKGKIIAVVAAVVLGGAAIVGGAHLIGSNNSTSTGTTIEQPNDSEQSKADGTESTNSKQTISPEDVYRDELLKLQTGGAVLQYAHLADLDGDGTDEVYVLYDDDKFALYDYDKLTEQATLVMEETYENGIYGLGEEWTDLPKYSEFYQKAYLLLNSNGVQAYLLNDDRLVLYDTLLSGDMGERWIFLTYENGAWKSTEYRWGLDESYTAMHYYRDDTEIDSDTYYQDCDIDVSMLMELEIPSDDLDNLLLEESNSINQKVKAAYKEYLLNYLNTYPESVDEFGYTANRQQLTYQFAYINEDAIPELIIPEGSIFASGVTVLTYYDGEVKTLGTGLGSNGTIYYKEKQNQLLAKVNKTC